MWFLHVYIYIYIGPLFSALEVAFRHIYVEGRTRDQLPIKLCPHAGLYDGNPVVTYIIYRFNSQTSESRLQILTQRLFI
jgi:hypothetical protein